MGKKENPYLFAEVVGTFGIILMVVGILLILLSKFFGW